MRRKLDSARRGKRRTEETDDLPEMQVAVLELAAKKCYSFDGENKVRGKAATLPLTVKGYFLARALRCIGHT